MKRASAAIALTTVGLVALSNFETHPDENGASVGSSLGNPVDGSVAAASQVVTGDLINTRFGPVQVQVTVQGGHIASVVVPTYPSNDGKSLRINQSALPALAEATIERQTGDVDTVSGATYTSDAYERSLQAALDAALEQGLLNG